MTLPTILKNKAQLSLENLFQTALSTSLLFEFADVFVLPTLAFNQRGNIAGSALLQKNIIKLNPQLFAENTEYFLSHIIAHELAHILVYQLYGSRVKPHGVEWKKMMLEVFNLQPKVTHSLDTKNVKLKSFMYKCACQHISLSVIRHNKVVRGKQSYMCRKCKQPLAAVNV